MVSARVMLEALIDGQSDPAVLACRKRQPRRTEMPGLSGAAGALARRAQHQVGAAPSRAVRLSLAVREVQRDSDAVSAVGGNDRDAMLRCSAAARVVTVTVGSGGAILSAGAR